MLHFSGGQTLGDFPARARLFESRSQLGSVGGVKETLVKLVMWLAVA